MHSVVNGGHPKSTLGGHTADLTLSGHLTGLHEPIGFCLSSLAWLCWDSLYLSAEPNQLACKSKKYN